LASLFSFFSLVDVVMATTGTFFLDRLIKLKDYVENPEECNSRTEKQRPDQNL